MENFDLTALGGAFAAMVGMIATLTQLAKSQLGLKGNVVIWVSVGLGALLGATGLEETGLRVFPALPGTVSGLLLGALAGAIASGGKDLVTGVQRNGVKARVNAEVEAAGRIAQAQLDALPPALGSAAALAEDLVPATIEDVLRHTGEWPAVPGLDGPPR